MAGSPQTTKKLRTRSFVKSATIPAASPGAILAFGSSWIDASDMHGLMAHVVANVATGGLSKVEIVANDESDGSGTTVVVKELTLTGPEVDAVNDQVTLECQAEEIREVGIKDYTLSTPADRATAIDLCYVNIRVTTTNAADVATAVLIGDSMHHHEELTPEKVIA